MNKISAYAKLLRIPGLGALATPPAIAAITVGEFDFYNLLILFIIEYENDPKEVMAMDAVESLARVSIFSHLKKRDLQ